MFFNRGYNELYDCFDGFGMMGGGWLFLIYLAVIAIVVTAVVLIVRNKRHQTGNRALDELKILFAKGEISEEEYLKRKKLIE